MELYQIEKQNVEQGNLWEKVREFVEGEALELELHEAELRLFHMLLAMGLSLMKEIVARHGDGRETAAIEVENGTVLKCHSRRVRDYLSIFGEMEIVRAYYWKEGNKGHCPLDAKLNLPHRHISYLLEQWLLSDVAETTYEEAIERYRESWGLAIWKREQVVEAQHVAGNAASFHAGKQAPEPGTEGPVLCVAADCKGVRMVPSEKPQKAKPAANGSRARLGKGEKTGMRRDAVVTSDFTFIPESREPGQMARKLLRKQSEKELEEQSKRRRRRKERGEPEPRSPLNKQLAASMYGKEAAFEALADRIERREPGSQKPIYILIDGEPALERGLRQVFSERGWADRIAGFCLDIYHVMEYVWEAATALHGEKNPEREKWVYKQTLAILEGRVGRVIGGLRQILTKRDGRLRKSQKKSLNKVITYFDNHKHMMRYNIYLAAGYPIGTGVIEGACGSLVKDRMDGSGKRWTKKGAQAVLDLRSIKRNGDWDDYWLYHIEQERIRLYEKAA